MKTNVWPLLYGLLWAVAVATLASVFVLSQGCYKAWGAPALRPAPPEDAALEAELRRFPPRAVVASWLGAQQRRLDRLYFMAENGWGIRADVDEAVADQKQRYLCWDTLGDIQCRQSDFGWRSDLMPVLRHMIGDNDFYAGRMPDPVTDFNPE